MFLADATQWILPIAVGLIVGVLIATRKNVDKTQIVFLDPEEFSINMRKGQLIDIRKESDFRLHKINGSRNFEKGSLFGQLHKIRKDQAIYLVDTGNNGHSKRFAVRLLKKGFKPVYVLNGGIKNWPYNMKEQ
ncbi:MAG: rhodanese-like domain-containing protein [Candidatus Izemoplasmatales bacterium]|jgi:rhodanese-related sulfurtransferase|nr:rhodanese-like domain-containing protein [Candidatus Izemoplasmatales bacterium]